MAPCGLGGRVVGSSPLARGLRHLHAQRGLVIRIIPARAGFTPAAGAPPGDGGDHPRSRGVYRRLGGESGPGRGSSPLARGLHAPLRERPAPSGIIPARAGFTPRGPGRRGSWRDHPRSRGVYPTSGRRTAWSAGSSPLARGLPASALHRARGPGIIPARAGFTARRVRAHPRRRDHPRSRGVYRPA